MFEWLNFQFKRFLDFWNNPFGPIAVIALVLAILDSLILDISSVTLGLLGLALAPWLISVIHHLELPGGLKITSKEFEKITNDLKLSGLLDEKNLSKTKSKPSFLEIYSYDPTLALAGLRVEIEKRIREIATLSEVHTDQYYRNFGKPPLSKLILLLEHEEILAPQQANSLKELIPLLNGAVHNEKIKQDLADWAIEEGPKILNSLDEMIKSRNANYLNVTVNDLD